MTALRRVRHLLLGFGLGTTLLSLMVRQPPFLFWSGVGVLLGWVVSIAATEGRP